MKIGKKLFNMHKRNHVYVMGILNYTDDSFSDGGTNMNLDDVLRSAERMVNAGADIIDIGAESTRPGYTKVDEKVEALKLSSAIRTVKQHFDVPVSADTYKVNVMKSALEAGADLANDIWGLRYRKFQNLKADMQGEERPFKDENAMAELIARFSVPVCIMHNDMSGRVGLLFTHNPEESGIARDEAKIIGRIVSGLEDSLDIASSAGIKRENIILDPGVGFAKTDRENMLVLRYLKELRQLKYPWLLAVSRKSVIGNALDLPVDSREEGTIVTSILAAEAGLNFVRVHDVEKNVRALKMYEAVKNAE